MKKASKAQSETNERNTAIAKTCGAIAGVPKSLATALEGIRDGITRLEKTKVTAGVLTQSQAKRVTDVSEELSKLIPTIEDCWKVIDGIIAAGIALPPKKPTTKTEDLF